MNLTTQNTKDQSGRTSTLATRINTEHLACMQAAGKAIEHAMRCGDLLTEAKGTCQHGEWQEWLAHNFDASSRTARAYMRLAENRQMIESKRQSVATLGVADAIRLIAAPRLDRRYPHNSDHPLLLRTNPPVGSAFQGRPLYSLHEGAWSPERVERELEDHTVSDS